MARHGQTLFRPYPAIGRVAAALSIGIAGAGRMGQRIAARLDSRPGLELAGIWRRGEDLDAIVATADVVIDFSLPEGTEQVLEAAGRLRKPLVCGVSGLDEGQMALLDRTATAIPLVYDRNMSQGIAVLEAAIRQVAGALGDEFTVVIEETHHAHKKDAPSGTALKLGEAVAQSRNSGDIPYKSERIGEVPGDHSVIFSSPTEILRFEHSLTTRDVFADGALRAALWVVGRAAGRYSMQDVLFGE
jgi:4-hydroxy-tetrahydrodipicolinate reductase